MLQNLFTNNPFLRPSIHFEHVYCGLLNEFKDVDKDKDSKRKMKLISEELLKSFELREMSFMNYLDTMDDFENLYRCWNHAYNIDTQQLLFGIELFIINALNKEKAVDPRRYLTPRFEKFLCFELIFRNFEDNEKTFNRLYEMRKSKIFAETLSVVH